MPFVCPSQSASRALNIGEVLRGDRITLSGYELKMGKDDEAHYLCSVTIDTDGLEKAQELVAEGYMAEWIVDNLPGATSFVSSDDGRKYYAAGFKIGYEEIDSKTGVSKYYINNHATIVIRYHKAPRTEGSNGKKVIVGFEVYARSVSNEGRGKDGLPKNLQDEGDGFELRPLSHSGNTDKGSEIDGPSENPTEASDESATLTIPYTYSVYFREEEQVEWQNRWDLYFADQEDNSKIHWLAIFNSIIILGALTAVVAVIIARTVYGDIRSFQDRGVEEGKMKLRRRTPKSSRQTGDKSGLLNQPDVDGDAGDSSEEENVEELTGWKLLHGDVFRSPPYSGLLAPLIGSGIQLLFMSTGILILSCLGLLNPSFRGGFTSVGMALFIFAGIFSGYFSGRIYKTFGGQLWKKNVVVTATLFPGVSFAIILLLNLLVWAEASSLAIPFGTLIALVALWLLIQLPLVYAGNWYGYVRTGTWEHPVKTNVIARQIPYQPWYSNTWRVVLLSGLVPFSVIFIELMFVFKSLWQDKSGFYYVYGFLAIVSSILLLSVIEVTIVAIYGQLCHEKWTYIAHGAATTSNLKLFIYFLDNLLKHAMVNVTWTRFLREERSHFAARYPPTGGRRERAIRYRWDRMTKAEKAAYFANAPRSYPNVPWADPVCFECLTQGLPCQFDSASSQCLECRRTYRNGRRNVQVQGQGSAQVPRCRRLCYTHRQPGVVAANTPNAPPCANDPACHRPTMRWCRSCAENDLVCTFGDRSECEVCHDRYYNGEEADGPRGNLCRELCGTCRAAPQVPRDCPVAGTVNGCTEHRLYKPGPSERLPLQPLRRQILLEKRRNAFKRKLIRSRIPAGFGNNWHGHSVIGAGGYGFVGLWIEVNGQDVIQNTMAVKDTPIKEQSAMYDEGHSPEHLWNQPQLWYDKPQRIPLETKIQEQVGQIQPRNIVQIRASEVYEQRGAYRIYMEYCARASLAQLVDEHVRQRRQHLPNTNSPGFPEAFLFHLFRGLARACVAMREVNLTWDDPNHPPFNANPSPRVDVVHCDLKDENVFLTRSDPNDLQQYYTIKIGDFGSSRLAVHNAADNPWDFDAGTPGWRSPETVLHNGQTLHSLQGRGQGPLPRTDQVEGRSNIFQIGLIMLFAVTGHLNLDHPDRQRAQQWIRMNRAQLEANVRFRRRYPINDPEMVNKPELRDLIVQCLMYDNQRRPDEHWLLQRITHFCRNGTSTSPNVVNGPNGQHMAHVPLNWLATPEPAVELGHPASRFGGYHIAARR
ncbi:MAG: hypothetical protein M1820_003132 [Bogoriella megaspora]|nr:MAG: hypothetical protein M1820_003132 [Bogoriella megaspora]